MEQGADVVQQEGLEPLQGSAEQPDAGAHVSSEAFLQATTIAWGHLQPAERKAIRACCRAGRLQHDRMLAQLRVCLGRFLPGESSLSPGATPPSPSQLHASLQAMVNRGARPQLLRVVFMDANHGQREAQLLAALAACSCCPLSRLELGGAVPLSGPVAEAVEACCPQLAELRLDHAGGVRSVDVSRNDSLEYNYGCVQLLTLCGPRLRELHLEGLGRWQPMSYMALRRCTALASLQLQASWIELSQITEGPALRSDLIRAVSHLETLRSLRLETWVTPSATLEALRPHATWAVHLSALTALTTLELYGRDGYEHHRDSWTRRQQDGEQHGTWVEVREAHRTSLLSALRAMPQLQHLDCPTLWLRPSKAVPFTALTSLTLGGLLPPPPGPGPSEVVDDEGYISHYGVLPPQLRELALSTGASPRALAQLQPPPSLTQLVVGGIYFGAWDVTPEGRLRPEAVAAVGPAVRRVVALKGRTEDAQWRDESFSVRGDGSECMLLPREGSPNGHMEWIQQLQGLDAFNGKLKLTSIYLSAADLCCLGQALPGLEGLELDNCVFPVVALPALRPPMLRLDELVLDLAYIGDSEVGVLETILLLVCRPVQGAAQLGRLYCNNCPHEIDLEELTESLVEKLENNFGLRWMDIDLTH